MNAQDVSTILIRPHPETEGMSTAEIKEGLAAAEETLKLARKVNDENAAIWATQDIRILEAALARRNDGNDQGGKKRESQADVLIKMVSDAGAKCFHTATTDAYISIPVNDHTEHWPVNSQATRQWLRRGYFLTTSKAPNSEALQAAIGLLESLARFQGETSDVHLRTARHEDAIYYDLCDSEWRAVRIDRDGWQIVENPEVKFIRHSHMAAQVEPEDGGNLDEIFDYINVTERHGRELIKSSLTVSLIPDIPRPAIALAGDQGSGKTSTAQRLRALIDPSAMPMVRCKDDAEIVQGLAHHYCPIIDNLSHVPEWLSDTLSRAVTGEGFTKRALYTNADDVLFSYKRIFILTGIGLVITKPDLLDRSIIILLDRIPDNKRRDEQALNERFKAAKQRLFGSVLNMLAGAIREYSNVKSECLPRMADFAKWAMAVELGQGRDPELFLAAFAMNVQRQNEEALNASVVATVLLALLSDCDGWSGQPHELYARLKEKAEELKIPTKSRESSFPGSAATLSRRLKEIRPNLIALGWEIDFGKSGPRTVTIRKTSSKSSVSSKPCPIPDDTDDMDDTLPLVTSREVANHEEDAFDWADGVQHKAVKYVDSNNKLQSANSIQEEWAKIKADHDTRRGK
jgi:hypothetical protein